MKSSRIRVCIFATMVGAVLFANGSSANNSWNGYHWARTSNPFTLQIGDNVSGPWETVLNTTIADWSQSQVLNMVKVPGRVTTKNCKPTAGRVEVCNNTYGFNQWLGIAQVWVSGGHITQGTTRLNDSYFNQPRYNTTAWRNLVSCQEVGHDIGLDHQDENFDNPNLGTCMDYTSDPSTNQHPNNHDYNQLEAIYAHLDNTTTVGALLPSSAPGAFRDLDVEGPGQWGRLVKTTRDGRSQTYELDLGHGNKIVTHVLWTDEALGRGR